MLEDRIARIQAALGRTRNADLVRFPARVINTPKCRAMFQDFRGGASTEELRNDAFTLIANVASLRDHLKGWARKNGRDPEKVDETIRSSRDLQILMDLWDSDKHGGHRRDGGYSELAPSLVDVDRALSLRTRAKRNSSVMVQSGFDGRLHLSGDGSATVETSGTVRDAKGNRIDDLQEIVLRAVEAWERLLVAYEIGRGVSAI